MSFPALTTSRVHQNLRIMTKTKLRVQVTQSKEERSKSTINIKPIYLGNVTETLDVMIVPRAAETRKVDTGKCYLLLAWRRHSYHIQKDLDRFPQKK